MSKLSKLPWSYNIARTLINIKGPNGEQICQIPIKDKANAALIVKAVNGLPNIIEILRWLDTCYNEQLIIDSSKFREMVKQTLAAVEDKEKPC